MIQVVALVTGSHPRPSLTQCGHVTAQIATQTILALGATSVAALESPHHVVVTADCDPSYFEMAI